MRSWRSRVPFLLIFPAALATGSVQLGCAVQEHWENMEARLEKFPVPPDYQFLEESRSGSKPFGSPSGVSRDYLSDKSLRETCDEMTRLAMQRGWSHTCQDRTEPPAGCSCRWWQLAGLSSWPWGTWRFVGGFSVRESTRAEGVYVGIFVSDSRL